METDLKQRIAGYYDIAEKASALSVDSYLSYVVIDSRPEPKSFLKVAEPWQWTLSRKFAPAIEHVAHVKLDYNEPKGFFAVLPKGHDKSSLIARLVNWALAFARIQWTGYIYAKDREQASYLLDAMKTEAYLNPWLARRLEFKQNEVTGSLGSNVKVMSCDAKGSQGQRPDLIICDELTAWDHNGEDLFTNLITGLRKRPCIFICITNAGMLGSWQHNAFLTSQQSTRWWSYQAPHRLSKWMDEEAIKEDRKLIPPALAARLYDNVWTDPSADFGYVTREEAQGCVDPALLIQSQGNPGQSYFMAVDYGPKKDRTALCILHVEDNESLVVDDMAVWQGSRDRPVSIQMLEDWIVEKSKVFNFTTIVVDPYQLESTQQKLRGNYPIKEWHSRGGQQNHEMAQNLRALIVNKRIHWPVGLGDIYVHGRPVAHTIVDELAEVVIKEMGYGFRIQTLPNGFDDRVVCLAMAAIEAIKSIPKKHLFESDVFW